jgi:hypothetical protein
MVGTSRHTFGGFEQVKRVANTAQGPFSPFLKKQINYFPGHSSAAAKAKVSTLAEFLLKCYNFRAFLIFYLLF